jgi:hypothetical protein
MFLDRKGTLVLWTKSFGTAPKRLMHNTISFVELLEAGQSHPKACVVSGATS